ncbi:MAG: hypothetical protein FWG03_10105, partial [Clostridiales bacterium]|nr:hypothetical protein [Clostridiales bacterium]
PEMPANVERGSVGGVTDYFIIGTRPDRLTFGDEVCVESGYLATPSCPVTERRMVRPLNGGAGLSAEQIADMEGGAPVWYCPLHNPNPAEYPTDPSPPPPPSSWSPPPADEPDKPQKPKKPKPAEPKPPTPPDPDPGDDDDDDDEPPGG